jgi:hypothetical protein
MSDSLQGLQAILGTDKRNPMFAVYRDSDKPELHVYYGFELLEVVPDDKTSPQFRLMVAQLYNAGIRGLTLIEVFDVDPKSMRKWGRALKSGDPETLVNAIQPRGPRKLTPEIVAYIKRRFAALYDDHPRNYGALIRQELLEIFELQISGEGLRPLFNELKAKHLAQRERLKESPTNPEEPPPLTPTEPSEQPAPKSTSQAEEPSAKKGGPAV